MRFILITLILISLPFCTREEKSFQLHNSIPKPKESIKTHYNGFGSKTAKKLIAMGLTDTVALCIAMQEHGGTLPESNNIGNIKIYSNDCILKGCKKPAKKQNDFGGYCSLKHGIKGLMVNLQSKHPEYQNKPSYLSSVKYIQENGYCPDKIWVERNMFWYKKLF
jgi:hypothetical protein